MQLRLYVADEFRPLADGKILAVGLFPDLLILVNEPPPAPDGTAAPLIVRLAFLACIMGLEPGEHVVSLSINDPAGAALPNRIDNAAVRVEVNALNLIVSVPAFEVRGGGTYTARVTVDAGAALSHDFSIEVRAPS